MVKMNKEIRIKREPMELIREKIESSDSSKEVKEFLHKVRWLEFEHLDELRPRIQNEYRNLLKQYAKKWERE